jgi:GTP-binding protein
MFIDRVVIEVAGGRGGDGCMSFRREKYVPRGGPDGGDGGKGGDVMVEATDRLATLLDLHHVRRYQAGNGGRGSGKSRSGKDGTEIVIPVPLGTVIRDATTGASLGELLKSGDRCPVAKGGRRGRGNEHFQSTTNQAPTRVTQGLPGEKLRLEITLKLIADVGLVGEPNAGKSTLLGVVSAARPKVAPYPFTTKAPVLGIVRVGDYETFVMVDIPGLIEGAHEGKGMGKEFLRHVERCRVLLYMVDVTSADPAGSYHTLRSEMLHHDPKLLEKPSVVALNKCDLLEGGIEGVDPRLKEIHATVFPISALKREGLETLLRGLCDALGR